jgi:hypothetical protein
MKGMIFTEFLEMVEDQFGLKIKDQLLQQAPHGGVYTATGNYDHREIVGMVIQLAESSGIPVADLLRAFGGHVFKMFVSHYGAFFAEAKTALQFLSSIESYIHVEVRKLYPDAELPTFIYLPAPEGSLVMEYESPRPLGAFAEGLVRATLAHYPENMSIRVEDFQPRMGSRVRFHIQPA